ncbi:hypothetical protein [uncultured Pseudacidovorax sp.]|uniref:hypothetical protein n=1 Tax=uncultured Pseudacidovorax sp. TaxID=679313 RepID=UPI0025DCBC2C|nr:hypothetical protein [uncultured Pseudacidovorax sp.]
MQLHVIEQGDLLAAIQAASVHLLIGCFLAGVAGYVLARVLFAVVGRVVDSER